MKEAVSYVQSGKPLCEAVQYSSRDTKKENQCLECKPGPSIVLTSEEEKCLVDHVVEMANQGFGLVSEDLM